MGLIFEVKQQQDGNLTASCHSESIFTQGVDLKELHSNINDALDECFVGRNRPQPADIHLLVSQE
ncbi:MAG: hypothetical protein AAFX93_00235 [Verrucomicrobiota bacterium]